MTNFSSPEIKQAHPRTPEDVLKVLDAKLKSLGSFKEDENIANITQEELDSINSMTDKVANWIRNNGNVVDAEMSSDKNGEDKNKQPFYEKSIQSYNPSSGIKSLRLSYIGGEDVRSGVTQLSLQGENANVFFTRGSNGRFRLIAGKYLTHGEMKDMTRNDYSIAERFLTEIQSDFPSLALLAN